MNNDFVILRKSRIRETVVTVLLSAVIAVGVILIAATDSFIRPELYALILAFILPFAVMTATDCLLHIRNTDKKLSSLIITAEALLISGRLCYNYLCAIDGGGFMGLTEVSHIIFAVILAHLIYFSVLVLVQTGIFRRLIRKFR